MPPTDALRQVASWLRCPLCADPLLLTDAALTCRHRHAFDVARQGYVNLLGRAAPQHADTPGMLAARDAFLASGCYRPIRDAVAGAAGDATRVLEAGAGTGWYVAGVLESLPGALGLATDISVPAARRAARAHPRLAAIVADTWAGFPVADGVLDAVLSVFAPRNPAEFARVLQPGGRLVVAVPGVEHLRELRERHGLLDVAADKLAGVTAAVADHFEPLDTTAVRQQVSLDDELATALIGMGPNAFHGAPPHIPGATVTIDVHVAAFVRLR